MWRVGGVECGECIYSTSLINNVYILVCSTEGSYVEPLRRLVYTIIS